MSHRRFILITFFSALFMLPVYSAELDWQIGGEMPYPVKGAQAIVKDSLIYVIGGYTDVNYAPLNLIQIYNPKNSSWQINEDTLALARYGHTAVNYRHSVAMFGGSQGPDPIHASLEMWDFISKPYEYSSNSEFARNFATSVVLNNSLFIIGGFPYQASDSLVSPYIIEYDLPTTTIKYQSDTLFTDLLPLQQMSVLDNDIVYVFGGAYNGIMSEVFYFNPVTHSWDNLPEKLFEERAAGAAIGLVENRILVLGGYNEVEQALATVELFQLWDGQVLSHDTAATMNYARSELTAAFLNDSLYVFGGVDAEENIVASIEKTYVNFSATAVYETRTSSIPTGFSLGDNYPNPFNPQTTIEFQLEQSNTIKVEIFDITGRHVITLAEGLYSAGNHFVHWNGSDKTKKQVGSGMYFYRLSSATQTQCKRMLLIR